MQAPGSSEVNRPPSPKAWIPAQHQSLLSSCPPLQLLVFAFSVLQVWHLPNDTSPPMRPGAHPGPLPAGAQPPLLRAPLSRGGGYPQNDN